MTTNEIKSLTVRALENMRGDDLIRARRSFRECSQKEMQEQYFSSGKTRQQILDEYIAHDAKIDDAINWIKSL